MKTLKLLTLLTIGFCVSLTAQSSTGTDLFIVLEKEGDAIIKSTDGRLFDAEPATYLFKGNKLILGKDSYVMLHYGLLTMQITEAGEYLLDDELFEDVLTDGGDFDPLFADFTAFSIEILVDAIEYGEWDIDRSNKGDGWGKKEKLNPGGWGKKDKLNPGGWGKKDKLNPGGWGVNPEQSKSGYGVVPPFNSGWGKKDKLNPGGWGKKDKRNPGGWGKSDPRMKGSWGKKDKLNPGGWGIDQMVIESKSPGGFYLSKISKVNWIIEDPSVKQYLFIIADTLDNLIYSEIAVTPEVIYDFSNLEKDKQYYWQILADGKDAISQPIYFKIKSTNEIDLILSECKSSSNYMKSGEILKDLMEIYVLEENGYFQEVYEKYEYLITKHPKNNLIRINYASFALRMGQMESAKELSEKL